MRTAFSFDDQLFREAKELAARDGEALEQLVERAVRQYLDHRRATPYRLELLTKEGRPTPDVDFDDRDALYEWMEGRERSGGLDGEAACQRARLALK